MNLSCRFIVGFFFGGIPWYVGAFVALCVRVDDREKPGYVACAIAVSAHCLPFHLDLNKYVFPCCDVCVILWS